MHPGRGRFETAPYSENRAENQPPATYCVTSVMNYELRIVNCVYYMTIRLGFDKLSRRF